MNIHFTPYATLKQHILTYAVPVFFTRLDTPHGDELLYGERIGGEIGQVRIWRIKVISPSKVRAKENALLLRKSPRYFREERYNPETPLTDNTPVRCLQFPFGTTLP